MVGSSRRNALAFSLGSWYLKRLIRKRGSAAVAGLVAGEGLSFRRRPHGRPALRWLVSLGLVGGAGLYWWRRRRGGGDDWGNWEPVPSPAPDHPRPEPTPDPMPEPTSVPDPVAT